MEGAPHYVEMMGSRAAEASCQNVGGALPGVCPTPIEQSRSYVQMSLPHCEAHKPTYLQWATPHMAPRSTATDTRAIPTRSDIPVHRTPQVPCKRSLASPSAAIPRKISSTLQCSLPYTPQPSPVPVKMTATPQRGITPITLIPDERSSGSPDMGNPLLTPPYTPLVERASS